MKKLYLIVDEWPHNRNFVESELNYIKKYFDVTVICNGQNGKNDEKDYPEDIGFVEFYRNAKLLNVISGIIKCFTDKVFYKELTWLKKEGFNLARLSEIIRFYINSEIFYRFLKKNGLIAATGEAIYYTYWYFWKCFALTKHKKELGNSKIITRVHGYDLYRDQIPTFYQPFKHFMDKNLDKICFVAEYGLEYYCNKFNIIKDNKHVLCKLGTADYGVQKYEKGDSLRLVSCSNLIELKRVHLIIDALACISDISVEWIHFGDGDLYGDLLGKAKEKLDKKPNIRYRFMGRLLHNDVMEYYSNNSIDAIILTSRSEGNPISVIEAMSFGIPVIAANICNMPNLVNENGIIISENPSPDELDDAIRRIARMSNDKLDAMRLKSRTKWETEYREDVNNEAFVKNVLMAL